MRPKSVSGDNSIHKSMALAEPMGGWEVVVNINRALTACYPFLQLTCSRLLRLDNGPNVASTQQSQVLDPSS